MFSCKYIFYYNKDKTVWNAFEEFNKLDNRFINKTFFNEESIRILNKDFKLNDCNEIVKIQKEFYKNFNIDNFSSDIFYNINLELSIDSVIKKYLENNIEKKIKYDPNEDDLKYVEKFKKFLNFGKGIIPFQIIASFDQFKPFNFFIISNCHSDQSDIFYESKELRKIILNVAKNSNSLCVNFFDEGSDQHEIIWEKDIPKNLGKTFEDYEEFENYLKSKYK